jgi:poly-gamma-glutamate synthesis protein (capsule biosynthesis protein)
VACLPRHADLLDDEIRRAANKGESVIVLVHGGDEHRAEVNHDQRLWSRWLVARGARMIAGAHPHVVQRTEWHGGAVILHSLGNAVYPKALAGVGNGEVRVFRISETVTACPPP